MTRYFGVSRVFGGFKNGVARRITYIGLEKVTWFGDLSNMPRSPHYGWSKLGAVPEGF